MVNDAARARAEKCQVALNLQAFLEECAEHYAPVPMNFLLWQNGSAAQGRALVACFRMPRATPCKLLFVLF